MVVTCEILTYKMLLHSPHVGYYFVLNWPHKSRVPFIQTLRYNVNIVVKLGFK